MHYPRIVPLAALLCATAAAQTPTIHLQVVNAMVDLDTHRVHIELQNTSDKPVVGYVLQMQQFDASGHLIGNRDAGVGVDMLPNIDGVNAPGWEPIQPGATAPPAFGSGTVPEAVSVKVTVTGVVYADRTTEGDAKLFFVGRANDAKECRAAIALLQPYPSTPQQLQDALEKLRSMPHGIGLGVFANTVHLTGEAGAILFDKKQPLPPVAMPTVEQWNAMVAALSSRASFLDEQSQEVTK